jgi:3-hydroxyisobutyrate dehydrogenase-like beta-hydroxyacid dehydrogenase
MTAPVFSAVGHRTIWVGEAGRGSRFKLVLNSWLAFLAEGLAETVALADGLGVTPDELRQTPAPSPLPGLAAISEQWHRAVGNRLGDLDISAGRLALQQGAPTMVGG